MSLDFPDAPCCALLLGQSAEAGSVCAQAAVPRVSPQRHPASILHLLSL